jgi:16S rRNA (adenine1518-N6/adenine1519-N6)-dimethyltransferase
MAGERGRGFPPVRMSLGQHFLSDPRILGRIADSLEPIGDRTVVEIGPGRGALTELLLERAPRVVAVELDRMLAEHLRTRLAGRPVEIVQADVLETDLGKLAGGPYVLVGNVPYYITTPILFHAMRHPRPERAVYLIQREVAERMSASAGDREYGALSANVQATSRVETLFRVPAGAFSPPPKVESAVVRITPLETSLVPVGAEEQYRTLVQGVFGFRRKQMRRVLRELRGLTAEEADAVLLAADVPPDARPETLSPVAFVRLLTALGPT